jgi:hypothetical protein
MSLHRGKTAIPREKSPSSTEKVFSTLAKYWSEPGKVQSRPDQSHSKHEKWPRRASFLCCRAFQPEKAAISTQPHTDFSRKGNQQQHPVTNMANQPATWDGTDAQGNPLTWDMPGLFWDGPVPEPANKPKTMSNLRVLLGFTTAADHTIEEVTLAVLENLYGNAAYANPPVTKETLQAALTAFTDAIAAQAQGGTAATADKANKRDALVALLRQLAAFVQEKCNGNLATLLSSGFEAVSTNRASVPLDKPLIREVINGNSGQLITRVGPIKNAKCYELRFAVVGPGGTLGPWQNGGLHTSSRSMPINDLTAGTMYQIQARAIGGSTGYSDWSDPTNHMSL